MNGLDGFGTAAISLSSSNGSVSANGFGSVVGGLVGYNGFGGSITQSYTSGGVAASGTGAFAGGLNWRDEAFGPLFGRCDVTAFVLGRDRVHAVSEQRCRPDHDPYDWAARSL